MNMQVKKYTSCIFAFCLFMGGALTAFAQSDAAMRSQVRDKAINLIGGCAKRRTAIVPVTASYDTSRLTSFPMEVQVGGATVFVLDVEQFIKL